MTVLDLWRAKTDDEVLAAAAQLDLYTAETQAVIRAERDRRVLQPQSLEPAAIPVSSSEDEQAHVSPRQASLKAARTYLASLNAMESSTMPATGVSSGRPVTSAAPTHSTSSATDSNRTRYEYKVVPFIGQSKGNLSAQDVARQLETVIAQHAAAGWEFCQLGDVNIEVQPGCLAGLFGASVHYVRFDQLIFKRSGRSLTQGA